MQQQMAQELPEKIIIKIMRSLSGTDIQNLALVRFRYAAYMPSNRFRTDLHLVQECVLLRLCGPGFSTGKYYAIAYRHRRITVDP